MFDCVVEYMVQLINLSPVFFFIYLLFDFLGSFLRGD